MQLLECEQSLRCEMLMTCVCLVSLQIFDNMVMVGSNNLQDEKMHKKLVREGKE